MKRMTILALSLIMLLTACGVPVPRADSGTAAPGAPAGPATLSSFTAVDLDGNEVDESIFADYDLTMINIWATFCGPCLSEMPALGELAAEYADKGVRVVGIVADVPQNSDGSHDSDMVSTARNLVQITGAEYLHLLPGADLYEAILNQVSVVPETIFVDNAGNIIDKPYFGARSKNDWASVIDKYLPEVRG